MDPWSRTLLATADERVGRLRAAPSPEHPALAGGYRGPELIYELDAIAARIEQVQALERAHDCRFLVAVKAIGRADALAGFARRGIGFDVSNRGEFELVRALGVGPEAMSLTGPQLFTVFADAPLDDLRGLHVNVDSAAQYDQLPHDAPITIGLRINGSSGARSGFSRFGVRADERALIERVAADPRACAIHMHVNNGKPGYADKIEAALAWLAETGFPARQINFGGGLEHFSVAELDALIAELRRRVGPGPQLWFEPGCFWFAHAGYARARVLAVDPGYLGDGHKLTLDISRVCHLQWAKATPLLDPADGPGQWTVFYGPTCVDGDVVSAATLVPDADGTLGVRPGDVIALTNVSGYAAAWNRGFNGIPPARVTLLGADA